MSDDLIKRSDAIWAITNHCENECYYRVDNWCPQCQREEFQEAIKAVPSADRPQGEWIRDRYWSKGTGMGEEYGFFYKCSLCEYEVENGYTRCGLNFCPYCGADMRKEK